MKSRLLIGILSLYFASPSLVTASNNLVLPPAENFRPPISIASDRPEDALPGGSYVNSCHGCKVQNGHWLTCICDGNKTSIDIDKCPSEIFSNDHGNLHCGEI